MTNIHEINSFEVVTDDSRFTLRDKLIAAQRISDFDSMQLFVPLHELRRLISGWIFDDYFESELQEHVLSSISDNINDSS